MLVYGGRRLNPTLVTIIEVEEQNTDRVQQFMNNGFQIKVCVYVCVCVCLEREK